jgi:hypothetical protein
MVRQTTKADLIKANIHGGLNTYAIGSSPPYSGVLAISM